MFHGVRHGLLGYPVQLRRDAAVSDRNLHTAFDLHVNLVERFGRRGELVKGGDQSFALDLDREQALCQPPDLLQGVLGLVRDLLRRFDRCGVGLASRWPSAVLSMPRPVSV